MSRIDATFAKCKAAQKTAFITFIPCGYKTKEDTVPILLACQAGGADIIEVGVPYSDPGADGPVIQKAHQNGVDQGITFKHVLATVAEARSRGLTIPVVLMGYFNNFMQYGLDIVCQDAKQAGADGFIIVDLPPEEAKDMSSLCKKHGINFIPLVAPTTSEERMPFIESVGSGFVYVVSLNGVTGSRTSLPVDVSSFVERVRRHISLPLALGFGLSTKEHVQAAGKLAEGAVIGSKICKVIDEAPAAERAAKVEEFCLSITS
ncbi:tryptophan synthase alpha chain [Saprolegnia diclina VS20]|uniref:tryptophan synthase n=1 Tax=Saprolegnia diclina (strain VS20) TaxID=1156394 RepID=T0R0C5_SAPDV|nr:tryptophan synthase alpha chain [Saprolegnia diclina VS20]EQC40401.1 tryptophan synthase alpha chain [Saprolegnia diclina VS20]|eukprot:XP_008606100.1 tryptophan synthase alpha chain [Saprolegnia diclina VS20]